VIDDTLLEKNSFPQHLVSAYLLQVAYEQAADEQKEDAKEQLGMSDDFWNKAGKEYEEQSKEYSITASADGISLESGPEIIGALLQKMAEKELAQGVGR